MDPFMLGLMSLTGANNPDAFANAMAQAGIRPDGQGMPGGAMAAGGGLAQFLSPYANPNAPAGTAGLITPTPMGPEQAGMPGTQSGLKDGLETYNNPMKFMGQGMMGPLQGVKTPEPLRPIVNAGVSGSQKAPEVSIGGQRGTGANAAILQALLGGGQQSDPLRVPALGSLLKGI